MDNLKEPQLLIADDDRDFREAISQVFLRRGYTTSLAADGLEALEIVQQNTTIHLILLDVHMPRLSGLEALQRLRYDCKRSVPCILMSALMDDSIVQRARQFEPAALLSKPFSLAVLTTTVESALRSTYGWNLRSGPC